MKLHRLEVEGFGPFRRPQVIDFDAFADDGLFLITGRTGAGKSSILDAVSFALYGSIPRYSAGEKRLRSDHSEPDEPTTVALEFSVGDERFRVVRSPEYLRPRKRGEGLTKQAMEVTLAVRDGDAWVGRGARAKDIDGELLPEILQLTKDQFFQVILLAQNRFAAFLLAKNDDRRRVLRTLFGTRRFEDYAIALEARSKASSAALAGDTAVLEQRLADAEQLIARHDLGGASVGGTDGSADGGDDVGSGADHAVTEADSDAHPTGSITAVTGASDTQPEPGSRAGAGDHPAAPDAEAPAGGTLDTSTRAARVRAAVPRAEYRASTARAAAAAAETEHDAVARRLADDRVRRDRQGLRDRTRVSLAALEARADAVGVVRSELSAADAAELIRGALSIADLAKERAGAAASSVARARTDWDALPAHPEQESAGSEIPVADPDSAASLRAASAACTTVLGELRAARDAEADLEHLRAAHVAAIAGVAEQTRASDALAAELRALPERIHAAESEHRAQLPVAARRESATAEVQRCTDERDAAAQAARVASDVERTELARSDAASAATSAGAHVSDLVRRRLHGYAGELAAALVPDEPCAVCGSRSHPAPAEADAEPVTEEDITLAEAARDAAQQAATAAEQAARTARETYASAHAAAGGRSLADAEAALDVARTALAEANSAAEAVAAAAARIDALECERADGLARTTTIATALDAAREAATIAQERLRGAETTVAAALGGYATVQERAQALDARRVAAEALASALDAQRADDEAERHASEGVAEQISGSTFDDVAAVRAALRPDAARAHLRATVSEYDIDRDRQRALLLELELELLPEEPIDLASIEAEVREARTRYVSAQQAATEAAHVGERLRESVAAIEAALAALGDAAAEHAVLARLADTVSGREPNTMKMALETFVLAAELEEIVAAANVRLAQMSSGRYRLSHTDERAAYGGASGLGIEVFDAHTGRTRPTSSLSGGETFLASLALALGLAEVVTARAGGVRLDTLFIDEGFGSLDAETLEIAMHTLDELRQGGRTVGVISHVEAMREQIPARLRVTIDPDGSSSVAQDTGIPLT